MDYSKLLVKGNVADLMTMFPSADGERVLKNTRNVYSGSATWRWRLVCQDGTTIDNVIANQPTATFIYHGADKYRRGMAENEDGLVIEIAFKDTKYNKDVYNTNTRRMPFSWLRPRMKSAMLAQYRYTPPDTIHTELITKQIRFVPTKVLYVGISSTMKRHPDRHGRMTIVSTATISPTKSDTTPTALPVEYYPHVRQQKDGDNTYHYVDAESAFSDLTSSHVLYGVEHLKFVLGDGTTSLSMERFGGYGQQSVATLKRFFNECQTTLVACEFKSTFRNGKEYDECYAERFAYICPLVVLPDMTEREGQTPLPCPVLQAQRERRGALKKELTEYVFRPERMFRLHGETYVDVMTDCY